MLKSRLLPPVAARPFSSPPPLPPMPPPSAPAGALSSRLFWLATLIPCAVLLVNAGLLFSVDRVWLMLAVQAQTQALPDAFWAGATLLGNGAMLFACMALAWRQRPDWLMAGLCALPFATLFARSGKLLIDSPRPPAIVPLDQLHVVGERLLQHSLPSGHTITAFVLAAIVLLSARPPRIVALLALGVALLVGLSRIAVGAHWPTDVLAGAACGWLAGALGIQLAQRWAWLRTLRAEQILAAIVLISSLSLLFINIGYSQATPFKWLVATLGTAASGHWLWTRTRPC